MMVEKVLFFFSYISGTYVNVGKEFSLCHTHVNKYYRVTDQQVCEDFSSPRRQKH